MSSAERRQRVIPLSFQLSGVALNFISLLHNEWASGVLVYDHEDPEVSPLQFNQMIDHWQNCEVHATRGLGHNRILKDDAVITSVVDFLKTD